MVKKISLKPKVNALKEQVVDLETKYKRALADYQNLERRQKDQESVIIRMANALLLEKIISHLDSLAMAQNHLQDPGLAMILKSFSDTLQTEGLQEIKSDGQIFDPHTMDCQEVVPGEKDVVVETVTKGYTLFDKVLRPAKVKVGSGN